MIRCSLLFFYSVLSLSVLGQSFSQTFTDSLNSLSEKYKTQRFEGSVLLSESGKEVYKFNSGKTGAGTELITDSTLYQIASISKSITAIAFLRAEEREQLSLSDPISDYLKEIPKTVPEITILQLLTHTSGIGRNYNADGAVSQKEAIKRIFKPVLLAKPGEKFIYSNDNYNLLAIILERVTGDSFENYIMEEVITPLEMNNTIFWDEYFKIHKNKITPSKHPAKHIAHRNYGFLGATGIFSTASDLVKMGKVFSGESVLSKQSLEKLTTSYSELAKEELFESNGYGLGIYVRKLNGQKVICLRGAEEGWGNAIVYFIPEKDISIVVLSKTEKLPSGERPHVAVSNDIIRVISRLK